MAIGKITQLLNNKKEPVFPITSINSVFDEDGKTPIKEVLESEKYILKKNDDLNSILLKYKNVFIPNNIEINIRSAIKTGMDGQTIEGNGSVINNISKITDVVRDKVVSLHVRHRDVTIRGLKIIGDQELNPSKGKEDISTGHGIYIPSLENANTLIENCTIINGYNGISVENGASNVVINNCTVVNCEHGIQIHRGRNVTINNYTHKIMPYGKSKGYCQRCIKVQGGGGDVVLNNAIIEMGRVTSFYIRNEAGNTEDIKNVTINNVKLVPHHSLLSDYEPYSGIYLEHEGDSSFENITIDGLNGDTPQSCILISKTESGIIKNLTISNVRNNSLSGRTIHFKTGLASHGFVDNMVVNNVIGNDLSIRATRGVISNVVTNAQIYGLNDDIETINVSFPNMAKTQKVFLLNGVMGDTQKIPYPSGKSSKSFKIINAQIKNTNGIWISTTFTLAASGITLGNSYVGNDYRLFYCE